MVHAQTVVEILWREMVNMEFFWAVIIFQGVTIPEIKSNNSIKTLFQMGINYYLVIESLFLKASTFL